MPGTKTCASRPPSRRWQGPKSPAHSSRGPGPMAWVGGGMHTGKSRRDFAPGRWRFGLARRGTPDPEIGPVNTARLPIGTRAPDHRERDHSGGFALAGAFLKARASADQARGPHPELGLKWWGRSISPLGREAAESRFRPGPPENGVLCWKVLLGPV